MQTDIKVTNDIWTLYKGYNKSRKVLSRAARTLIKTVSANPEDSDVVQKAAVKFFTKYFTVNYGPRKSIHEGSGWGDTAVREQVYEYAHSTLLVLAPHFDQDGLNTLFYETQEAVALNAHNKKATKTDDI